jgi:carbon monoxide dehydrogenase subunit G
MLFAAPAGPAACARCAAAAGLLRRVRRGVVLCALLTAGALPAVALSATSGAVMQGTQVISWGRVEVSATPELAFAVLTDYDRMADFLPGMLASEVVSRNGNSVVIEQSADQGILFFSQRVDARLAIDESPPRRLTIRALAGSFKELSGVYELTRLAGGTAIEYRARFTPGFSLPPMVGMYAVQHSLQRHLAALAQEIERRSADSAAVSGGGRAGE